jgi:hypothetical protein
MQETSRNFAHDLRTHFPSSFQAIAAVLTKNNNLGEHIARDARAMRAQIFF